MRLEAVEQRAVLVWMRLEAVEQRAVSLDEVRGCRTESC